MENDYLTWLRNHVGSRKIFLPFVTVIVRDENDRILVQRRSDFDFWGLPGGILELNETIENGARRELGEETGLTVGDLRLVGVYTDPRYDVVYPNGDQVQQFTFCLEGRLNGGSMRADGVETTSQQFVPYSDLEAYRLPNWYRDMIDEAERGTVPQFRPPYRASETGDQIAAVRPHVGKALISGMGVSAVLSDNQGRILMLQHSGEAYWRLPSGFADLGENAAHTAVRELKEELGLDIEPVRIIGVYAAPRLNTTYANGDQVRIVGVVFTARVTGGRLQLDRHEVTDLRWMRPQDIPAVVHPSRIDHYRAIIRHLADGYFVN